MQQYNNRKSPNGVALIELIISIAIIGILFAISTLGFIDYNKTAKLNAVAN